jgi:hypothetical protein
MLHFAGTTTMKTLPGALSTVGAWTGTRMPISGKRLPGNQCIALLAFQRCGISDPPVSSNPDALPCRDAIQTFQRHAVGCNSDVHFKLLEIAKIADPELDRYPQLKTRLLSAAETYIKSLELNSRTIIEKYIKYEKSYITDDHESFREHLVSAYPQICFFN